VHATCLADLQLPPGRLARAALSSPGWERRRGEREKFVSSGTIDGLSDTPMAHTTREWTGPGLVVQCMVYANGRAETGRVGYLLLLFNGAVGI
jgi:hypothetical protein